MKIYLVSLLFFIFNASASESFHQVNMSLNIQGTESGEELKLERNYFVRAIDASNDLGSWQVKVQLVDDYNVPISDEVFITARKYFNRAVAIEFEHDLPILDENGRERKLPKGTKVVRLEDSESGVWKHYKLVMVNEEGEMVDWNGDVTSAPPVLKTSVINFNREALESKIVELIFSKEKLEASGDPLDGALKNCDPTGVPGHTTALETSVRPRPRPERVVAASGDHPLLWRGDKTPHEIMMSHRGDLKGKRGCASDQRAREAELLASTSWGELSLQERANKVYETAQETLATLKTVTSAKGGRSAYANSVNADYLWEGISSELATCIAFQETSGHLNPFSQNYTYCNDTKGMASTAHGLGQMTRTTFRLMKEHPEGDQMPFNTAYSKVLEGMNPTEAHAALSLDPHLQLEVVLRTLNFEAKHALWKNSSASGDDIIKAAIIRYDHDNQSKYVDNVFNKCLPCMKNKSAGECYAETWD